MQKTIINKVEFQDDDKDGEKMEKKKRQQMKI
jgi:hypothetical protein